MENNPFVVEKQTVFDDTLTPYEFPNGLIVKKNAILTVKPGATILIGKRKGITVFGSLIVDGQSGKTVKIAAKDSLFDRIYFKPGSKNNKLRFLNIIDGGINVERTEVDIFHINIYFNFKRETNIGWPVIYSKEGNVKVQNTYIHNNSGGYVGEGIVSLGGNINIMHSGIYDIPDAIEFTQVKDGQINSVIIAGSGDDGIDLNSCRNITIQNAVIKNVADKAITIGGAYHFTEIIDSLPIGPSNNIIVSDCYISNAKYGVGIKDSSDINLTGCVIKDTKTAFLIVEKNKGQGSGILTVNKSILYNYDQFIETSGNAEVDFKSIATDKEENLVKDGYLCQDIEITETDFNKGLDFDNYILQAKRNE